MSQLRDAAAQLATAVRARNRYPHDPVTARDVVTAAEHLAVVQASTVLARTAARYDIDACRVLAAVAADLGDAA